MVWVFYDVLQDMGVIISKADNDVWMLDCGDHYKYIAIYVDNLGIASKDPASIVQTLREKYGFKIKGDGEILFCLVGCDYYCEKDGKLVTMPMKYIEKMMDSYHQMFQSESCKSYHAPLEPNDHPEVDVALGCVFI